MMANITGNAGNDWFFDKMSNLGFEHTGFIKDLILRYKFVITLVLYCNTNTHDIINMHGLKKKHENS